ncbi:MAG: phosphatase [Lachnospiraceae bacterium]|nr:phosphatase [Lachnospiraceae bacterium]
MKYVLDSHTHTIASGHAYNTIREMTQAAADKGLELLAITEHSVTMPGSCHEFYFQNYRNLDRNAYALPTLFGVELNILDENGTVDMPDVLLPTMDVTIASLHPPCVGRKMTKNEVTQSVIRVLENPWINIIGHLDDDRFPVDYDEVARAAAANHKLFEVNNSSIGPGSYRPGARDNYLRLLECCEKHDVEIILNSDAHTDTAIGAHQYSEPLILESGFPLERIVNDSLEHYFAYLKPEAKDYFKNK